MHLNYTSEIASTKIMENLPFHKLPAELRNRIWTPILTRDDGTLVKAIAKMLWLLTSTRPKLHALALLATCRQIREESLPLLLHENEFKIGNG